MAGERLLDFDSSFIRGTNSSGDPSQLPLGYVWNTINMINVSGVLSCRPGHRCVIKLPRGNLQGLAVFKPQIGLDQLITAVDGVVYKSIWPYNNFYPIPNITFRPEARQIFFTQATQSARRLVPGSNTSAIEVITPRNVLFMQDGGFSAPGYYDGSASGQIRGSEFETPSGSSMAWIGDRLWVARGNTLFASDIANPFSFVEQDYLGGTVGFIFSGDITALVATSNVQFPQLLVYTNTDTSLVQASMRDRSKWATTEGFQREILQVGCVGSRAVSSHFGRLIWFSAQGVVIYDAATAQGWTARSPIRDNEMLVSKKFLKDDLSLVAMGTFGQWLLISVPSGDFYNKHTWVFNNASYETVTDEGTPTWSGFWLGTRPVEWVSGNIVGAERIYHVSADEDGENRLWESFRPEALDNGCPIAWMFETRGYFGLTSPAKKAPAFKCSFAFADVELAGVSEDLDLGIFVAPGIRGDYRQILGKRISAMRGSIRYDTNITATTKLFAYKPQTRTERTIDEMQAGGMDESGSCPVESDNLDGDEESFQLLVAGHGPASIRWIRTFAIQGPDEDFSGDPNACVNEKPFNIVRFDGKAIHNENETAAIADIEARFIRHFDSLKTLTLTYNDITAVGIGSAESIVAQQAADRVAEIIATKQAELEITQASAPFLSLGLGFDGGPCQ